MPEYYSSGREPRRYNDDGRVREGNRNTTQGMADLLKYALIVVSTVPVLCFYPFVQKYFIKGVVLGAVKG